VTTQPVSSHEGAPLGSAQTPAEAPAPQASVALQCLLALAVFYTIYCAKSLLVPIVVALFFALMLSPLVEVLKRAHVPRAVSAILLLSLIGVPVVLLTNQLAEPAQRWAVAIPALTHQLSQHVDDMVEKLSPEQVLEPPPRPEPKRSGFFGMFGGDSEALDVPALAAEERSGNQVSDRIKQGGLEAMLTMLAGAPVLIAQLLTIVMLILFLLIFGSGLFIAWVNAFPKIQDKRLSIVLTRSIQLELSRYIVTVSVINACLGLTTAAVLWMLGVQDALLWGVLVGMLNFAPYVGPLIGVTILLLAGLVQYGAVGAAMLPALAYFTINMLEAQFITPLVLGRNMRLNPLVVIVWLFIWAWLWGAVGVLLAVPLLVCFKLAMGQTRLLNAWVQVMETRA